MTIVLDKVTRVEVIDTTGRVFVGYYQAGVDIVLQDNERTLKVFTGEPSTEIDALIERTFPG